MNKKIIKVLAILIIVLLFINQSYAINIDSNTEAVGKIPLTNVIGEVVLFLNKLIQIVLLILSFVLTIIGELKSKNKKSFNLIIWIILAIVFLYPYTLIRLLNGGWIGFTDINDTPEEKMRFAIKARNLTILASLAGYAILTIMILIPIKKIKKYKKSDKISKGEEENVRND